MIFPVPYKESLFLLCRDLASTFEVQSPLAVARIFLTGYPSILGRVYVDAGESCLQTIKIPPNSKKQNRKGYVRAWQISSPKHRFFYSVGLSCIWLYKEQSRQTMIAHLFIGSASYASGSYFIFLFIHTAIPHMPADTASKPIQMPIYTIIYNPPKFEY